MVLIVDLAVWVEIAIVIVLGWLGVFPFAGCFALVLGLRALWLALQLRRERQQTLGGQHDRTRA